jgi:hypothetical protein
MTATPETLQRDEDSMDQVEGIEGDTPSQAAGSMGV